MKYWGGGIHFSGPVNIMNLGRWHLQGIGNHVQTKLTKYSLLCDWPFFASAPYLESSAAVAPENCISALGLKWYINNTLFLKGYSINNFHVFLKKYILTTFFIPIILQSHGFSLLLSLNVIMVWVCLYISPNIISGNDGSGCRMELH